jgi:hypothetical protein
MGSCPDWYPLISAARWLHVAPWELAEKPVWWMRIALAARAAEAKERKRREEKKG